MTDEKAHDDQFRDYLVTEVVADEHGWELRLSTSSFVSLDRTRFDSDVPRDLEPREGDTVRLYGQGVGYGIRGVDLNGRQLYYQTRVESAMEQWRTTIESTLLQGERVRERESELDAKVAALSPRLRACIERYRAEDPDFRWKEEALALVVFVAADRIAEWVCRENGWTQGRVGELEALQTVEAFRTLAADEREARIRQVNDRQSGASLRLACELAMALLSGRSV